MIPGLHQISKVGFGSIYSAKRFCLPHAEASYGEITPRGLHLVQRMIDCLGNVVADHIDCPRFEIKIRPINSESVDTFATAIQRSTSRLYPGSQERVRRSQPFPLQIAQAWSGRFHVPLLPSVDTRLP
ncbi:hypothetical protein IVA87_00665, partial [Bradyrhizobium sp. 147]|uniref:hypothetical protein n=1 Tax=Bradyrhizobium sp. 147 TaxID=2782623 RepID=UPI001FF73CD4